MGSKLNTPIKYPLTIDTLLDTAHMLSFLKPKRDSLIGSFEYGSWAVDGSATLRVGGILTNFVSNGTISATVDADGQILRATSGAVSGNDAGWYGGMAFQTRFTAFFLCKFKLSSVADVRDLIGLTNNNLAGSVDADNPTATNIVALQYSTDRPDTNFQFITKGGGAPTITDSGLAADTAVHYLLIALDSATSVRCIIYNSSLVQQASSTIILTLPDSTTNIGPVVGLETRAAAAKIIDLYGASGIRRIDL